MAITKNDNLTKIWSALKLLGCTDQGAAGMLGNVYAESAGGNPTCVEALLIQRYKTEGFQSWPSGSLYSQTIYDKYTSLVDSGTISKAEFLSPRQYTKQTHQYGYGICQWTTKSRKERLWSYTREKGLSIGSIDGQIELLKYELQNNYPKCLSVLKSAATTISDASDYILVHFEAPANVDSLKKYRRDYAKQIYNLYKNEGVSVTSTVNTTSAIDKVISIAEGEIGYLEKKTNRDLDSKTGNAGSANYTKYWRDVYPAYQGQYWCACFVTWCFLKAFGKENAKKLLKHYPYVTCAELGNLFTKKSNPTRGDIVIFWNGSRFSHTGIVTKVEGDKFYTIEGNTSGASSIVSNGGGVCKKSYYNSRMSGTKFCTPDYSLVSEIQNGGYMFTVNEVKKSDTGKDVKLLQRLLKGNKRTGKNGEEIEVDGEFGDVTDYALREFQTKKGLSVDGVCGDNTWKTLLYRV